jgi:hypothetical protein
LGKWVDSVRHNRRCTLTPARRKQLDELGFQYGRDALSGLPNERTLDRGGKGTHQESFVQLHWDKNIVALCDFRAKHGHCNVPRQYPDNPSLGVWTYNVRYANIKLSYEMEKDLKELGFYFYPRVQKINFEAPIHEHCGDSLDTDDSEDGQQTQKEGSSLQRKVAEQDHAPQDFQDLDHGQFDDCLDTDD